MSPFLVISLILGYFFILLLISQLTSRGADTETFFTGNRQSPWYVVAFGMIGASLSGVTFISVPGWVATSQFSYMQMVLGYLAGYTVIILILLPLYYKLNLISIYGYLEKRFGYYTYKTGAFFFLLSRVIGASFRLFLVATVLQLAIFDAWDVPFWISVLCTILLIWVYTFRGGIKTIVWTDTLQTLFMLVAVGFTLVLIKNELGWTMSEAIESIQASDYSQIFFWDGNNPKHFLKQFLSGAFIAIVMTGLDQDMMQKNLTCRNLKDAQKNMAWFSVVLVFVNLFFLCLGAMLYLYANSKGIAIPERSDELYPMLALNNFSVAAGILFLLGIIAAAYSSADSALTALTTSFCIDILGIGDKKETEKKKIKFRVHLLFSFLLFLTILVFDMINNEAVISAIFKAAGFTYGPLLGLFSFGLFTKLSLRDKATPIVCVAAPLLSYIIYYISPKYFEYTIGFEILLINGALTFLGLLIISKRES